MFAIITVLLFPPNESLSNLVSFESRYGTKNPFLFLSPKAFMQLASAKRDRFILAPYINLIPLFSVTVPLSEPAKSIRDSFPVKVSTFIFLVRGVLITLIWNTAWLLDEVWFALVASVVLLLLPIKSNSITCYVDSAANSVTPAMETPFSLSSLN